MLVVMVHIPVGSQEEGSRIEERFRNRAGVVDSMPGFEGFELLRGERELISVTRWATQEDFDKWRNSEANAAAHARMPKPTGGGHSEGEVAAQQQPSTQAAGDNQSAAQRSSVTVYEVVIPAANKS